jgi:Uma2 family endonuclease
MEQVTIQTTSEEAAATRRQVGDALLASGDRMSRAEFHRRYEAMPELKKAELVEGVVHVPSPLGYDNHGEPHLRMVTWLGIFVSGTRGVGAADNATLLLDEDNEVQPDVLVRIDAASGGRSRLTAQHFVQGAPELVVEIAASSSSYDLHDKKNAYRRNGVQEYLVWRVLDRAIDWWELVEGQYVPLPADEAGLVCSRVFPCLCLDVPAMLAGDLARVIATQEGHLGSAAHAAFVARLGGTLTQ